MKIFFIVFGIILLLMGFTWFLQGLNVLMGSVMSGKLLWVAIGAVTVIIGGVLLLLGVFKKKTA